jgi:hypothetical protein
MAGKEIPAQRSQKPAIPLSATHKPGDHPKPKSTNTGMADEREIQLQIGLAEIEQRRWSFSWSSTD